jgi:hypothetical protein
MIDSLVTVPHNVADFLRACAGSVSIECRMSNVDWRLAKDKTHQVCFTGIAPELQSQSRVDAGLKTKMGLFLIRRVSIEGWIMWRWGLKNACN